MHADRLPPSHHNAPPGTSEVAAQEIAPTAATLRAAVYALLLARGEHGATDEEMQDELCMVANTQRPRRWELYHSGDVVDSGRRRKTHSNRSAAVWVVKSHAPREVPA